jgi:hypothetical protein
MRRTLLLFTALSLAAPAHAEPTHDDVRREKLRVLPAAAAVVPGVVVHGAGHYAAGESETAKNLLLMQGIGLGVFLSGGLTIVFTGASRYLVATSYVADIYGTVQSEGDAATTRYRLPARWETELGYRRIEDPQFAYRDFVVQRVSRQIGPLKLSPSGWFSTRGDTARYRAEAQWRLLQQPELRCWCGDFSRIPPRDISHLDLTLAVTHQRHRPEHFAKSSVEMSLDGRYDLARLGRTLRGSFIELGAGYALGRIDYDLTGISVPHDLEHLLLGRIGFGVTLRGLSKPGSEFLAYYDHRHDDYVAGLKLTGIGSGVIGHFGLATRWFFSENVGVLLDAQVGSAYLAGASLLFSSSRREAGAW